MFLEKAYSFYEDLRKNFDLEGCLTTIKLQECRDEDYLFNKWLRKFITYTKVNFSPYVSTIFIHGSCADLQLTKFSDLDTFVILKRQTVLDSKRLIEYKKVWLKSVSFLYKFDPIQHHTHMIATEFDSHFFPYHWLPPQVISGSKAVVGDLSLTLNIHKSNFFLLRGFYQLLQRFRDPKIYEKRYNKYSLKNDISVLSLFPVLFLQATGIDAVKKDSFKHPDIEKLGALKFYKEVSRIRLNWKNSTKDKFFLSALCHPVLRKIYLKYLISKDLKENYLDNARLKPFYLDELNRITTRMSNILITTNP